MDPMRRMSIQTLRHMSCACASILMSFVKWSPRFFAVVENDMTLHPNEREVQFKFVVHLFGRMRRHYVFLSFNCSLFSTYMKMCMGMHMNTYMCMFIWMTFCCHSVNYSLFIEN